MVESAAAQKLIVSDIDSTEKFLAGHGVAFTTIRHEQVFTIPEMLEKVKFEGAHAKAVFAKNLFL